MGISRMKDELHAKLWPAQQSVSLGSFPEAEPIEPAGFESFDRLDQDLEAQPLINS